MLLTKYYAKLFGFIVALIIFRMVYTQSIYFIFIIFNLLLAFIPYLISCFFVANKINSKTISYLIAVVWLMFLPNAPYLITDLFHLHKVDNMPLYFDLIFLLMASFLGLLFFYNSIINMQNWAINNNINIPFKTTIIFIMLLSGVGIYLGRYLRLNSWDVFFNTSYAFKIIFNSLSLIRFYGVSILFGISLYLIYEFIFYGSNLVVINNYTKVANTKRA